MEDLIVIAIGGNSLIRDSEHMTVYDQYRACGETSRYIAGIVESGGRVVITHGNGPQVGFILLRSELAKDSLHQVPLDTCGADTQGAIGYQIAQTLGNELRQRGVRSEVVAVVTQTLVDRDDPGFATPTKPIGPFYSEETARQYQESEGWHVREDAGRGWRRVVPSPRPLEIIEEPAIRHLLEQGITVVAAGGGGIPTIRRADGNLEGVAAVIDKDLTSCLLAKNLRASTFVMSTSVDRVAIHFGTPEQRDLDRMTLSEAKAYSAEGHFAPGSMGPKIEAAIDFVEHGGERAIVTQPHLLEEALHGEAGTQIVP